MEHRFQENWHQRTGPFGGTMTQATPARRRIVPLACIALAASLISPLAGALPADGAVAPVSVTRAAPPAAPPTLGAAAAAPELTAASPPDPAHPFSDPIYSPFRVKARVSCVRTNCPGPFHDYWAIDFVDTDHSTFDPIYAPGAGIFHIGALMGRDTCSPAGTVSAGTWVWIDHGAGRATRFHHLYEVTAREGQLVTPATMIGRMGHNGNGPGCERTNYMHMEYRANGVGGTRLPPRLMLACAQNGRVSMPSSLGYATWDEVPTNLRPGTKPDIFTPTATNDCLATSPGANTPNRPPVAGRGGPLSATVSWGVVPAGVDQTLVTIERWSPSLRRYSTPVSRTVIGRASSTRFTGLLKGRTYRFRVTEHNGAGFSAWSAYVSATATAGVPQVTRARAVSTTRTTIQYSWWMPGNNGATITRFQVARRCMVRGSWTTWGYTRVPARVNGHWNQHYNWTRMPRGRTCEVRVRAVNSVGSGPWSTPRRATTRR